MKKWFLLTAFAAITFCSCKKNKDCTSLAPATVATAAETAYLQNYLSANNITAAINKQGMFYVINNQGSGASPNLCSSISLSYTGKFINGVSDGTTFDSTPSGTTRTFTLSSLVASWQIIFPLVKSGGEVTLYVPPSLGYGAQGNASIPGNSYLKFTVTLADVQ